MCYWQDLVRDGEIQISQKLWRELNITLDQPTIRFLISEAIEKGGVPIPRNPPTRTQALDDFQQLQTFEAKALFQTEPWKSGYPHRYHLLDETVGLSRVGLISSDLFHQENRWRCPGRGYPSAYQTWQSPRFRDSLLKALWSMKHTQVTAQELRHCLSTRKYIAAQFRPTVAKAFFERFDARRILDFSAGWGDRLSAAIATSSVEHYTGIDPNPLLHDGYRQQVALYNQAPEPSPMETLGLVDRPAWTATDVRFLCCPAEDMDLGDQTYDLVFTSPPYFDKERYTDDSTQSWVRYKRLDVWLQRFLCEALRRAWAHLEVGGHLVININDALSKKRVPEAGTKKRLVDAICDPMNDCIGSFPGAHYLGAVGMRMASRPKQRDGGQFFEPIWVWEKQQ